MNEFVKPRIENVSTEETPEGIKGVLSLNL